MKILISCQGTIQLLSAVAALKEHTKAGSPISRLCIVVSDLYATDKDIPKFLSVIYLMIRQLHESAEMFYLCPQLISTCVENGELNHRGVDQIRAYLNRDSFDSLFVSTTSHRGNRALIEAFPNCELVCYGDGPALYIPDSDQYLTRRNLTGRTSTFQPHIGYFLSDCVFVGTPPYPSKNIPLEKYISVFKLASKAVSLNEVEWLSTLPRSAPIAVLATSNFSEAGRLHRKNELRGYLRFLEDASEKTLSHLILKPHPRDCSEKISSLYGALRAVARNVHVLDYRKLKYFPFEILILRAIEAGVIEPQVSIEMYTFSSAALSFSALLGADTRIGFGDRLNRELFNVEQAAIRAKHEAQLRAALRALQGNIDNLDKTPLFTGLESPSGSLK